MLLEIPIACGAPRHSSSQEFRFFCLHCPLNFCEAATVAGGADWLAQRTGRDCVFRFRFGCAESPPQNSVPRSCRCCGRSSRCRASAPLRCSSRCRRAAFNSASNSSSGASLDALISRSTPISRAAAIGLPRRSSSVCSKFEKIGEVFFAEQRRGLRQ